MLDALGIDATAEVVYREMPAHPQEGVAELVRGLGWPRVPVRTGAGWRDFAMELEPSSVLSLIC
ncbi:hypothetical protein [Streptomyces cellostaticus]|uniref:hypothetical protein n=1 Tax=Streptomyces cellostaticus TaxID=67285 RepID=UPI0020268FE5|nr:hypothetical protein [Streptomyces cellostaticus]